MNKPLLPLVIALAVLVSSFACTACTAPEAGQLTATEIDPLVETVTQDLEAYVELGVSPSGFPLTAGERHRILGGVIILRNAVLAGMDEELEPLPVYEVEDKATPDK